jgi:hypothetical protein
LIHWRLFRRPFSKAYNTACYSQGHTTAKDIMRYIFFTISIKNQTWHENTDCLLFLVISFFLISLLLNCNKCICVKRECFGLLDFRLFVSRGCESRDMIPYLVSYKFSNCFKIPTLIKGCQLHDFSLQRREIRWVTLIQVSL